MWKKEESLYSRKISGKQFVSITKFPKQDTIK